MTAVFIGGKYDGLTSDTSDLERLDLFNGEYTRDESDARKRGEPTTQPAEIDNLPLFYTYDYPYYSDTIIYTASDYMNALTDQN